MSIFKHRARLNRTYTLGSRLSKVEETLGNQGKLLWATMLLVGSQHPLILSSLAAVQKFALFLPWSH